MIYRSGFRMLLILAVTLSSACSMLHEKEPAPSQIKQNLSSSSDCTMPEPAKLMNREGHVDFLQANSWISCFRKTIDKSFGEVKGSEKDAVAAKELYRLAKAGLISLPLTTAEQFEGAGGFMSLLSPEGHPSVTKTQALALADLLKEALDVYQAADGNIKNVDRNRLGHLFEHALILFPGKGEFTQSHLKSLTTLIDDTSLRSTILSAFPAFRLVFRNSLSSGGETRLPGSSLREFFQVGVDSYAVIKAIPSDDFENGLQFASLHQAEVLKVLTRVNNYFHQDQFSPLSAKEFRNLLVDSAGTSSSFSDDILLLARRFTGEADPDLAVSVKLLYPFLDDAPSLVADWKTLAGAFPELNTVKTRGELLAMNNPLLTSIALKANTQRDTWAQVSANETVPYIKRKDMPIQTYSAIEAMDERFLFKKLFVAFGSPGHIDPVKGIYIPKKALSAADERDAKDLARLFLKFATSLSQTSDDQKKNASSAITIDDQFTVKAESVYRIMGLVGDRWFLDGNNDGYLNAEEFYSVITLFMEASRFTYFNYQYTKSKDIDDYWKHPVYARKDFIENLVARGLSDPLASSPYAPMESSIDQMKNAPSLFHSLISRSDDPITAFYQPWSSDFSAHPDGIVLKDWVEGSGMVPANAILGLLDRAFLKCDTNADETLSWDELDCAADLLSGGLYHVAESGAINLDAGVHDGVILVAKSVYDPGITSDTGSFEKRLKELPRQVFKLFLSQGGASVSLDPETLNQLSFKAEDLIPSITLSIKQELLPIYLAEVNTEFGDCDLNHDNVYAGAELECVFDHAAKKWLAFLRTPDMQAQIHQILPFFTTAQIERVLTAPDFKVWFVYLTTGKFPIVKQATGASILDAFESAIRRSCPLGMLVVEDQCLQP